MNGIEALAAISNATPASPVDTATQTPAAVSGPGFLDAIGRGMDAVQTDSQHASAALTALATDPTVATHDVILAMEQARLSLQLAAEVRQRLVDAYKEITSMQV